MHHSTEYGLRGIGGWHAGSLTGVQGLGLSEDGGLRVKELESYDDIVHKFREKKSSRQNV